MIKNLFFDLECIPGVDWFMEEAAASVAPPANYKDHATIAKWWDEHGEKKRQEAMAATCFKPLYGRIINIAWAIDDEPVQWVQSSDWKTEAGLLRGFWDALYTDLPDQRVQQVRWIGHNIIGFDIPYLRARCMVNKVSTHCLPPSNIKPWETHHAIDTLYQLSPKDFKGHSLANMAKLFDLKDLYPDMDGSMVWDLYREGRHSEIASYCENDVDLVRQLYHRIKDWL